MTFGHSLLAHLPAHTGAYALNISPCGLDVLKAPPGCAYPISLSVYPLTGPSKRFSATPVLCE